MLSCEQAYHHILAAKNEETAAEDAERIVDLPYLDGCILGVYDLSGSIEKTGDVLCEENMELVKKTIKAGKSIGISTASTDPDTISYTTTSE